ncbi:MAG: gluconeogenesis factor YvcK family protein [Candidatus Dojkabacteria bacterium]
MTKLVAIGGGGGTSCILQGAQGYFHHLTAIVGVTDTGRSTGIARELGDMPAPGDIRNTIVNLAKEKGSTWAQVLNYRFHDEDSRLNGMALGNLLIAAMNKVTGDFSGSIKMLQELIHTSAVILPVSAENVHLNAQLIDGSVRENELEVREPGKPRIDRVYLSDEDAKATPEAINTVLEADVIVIGPGSLFTSVLSTVIFRELREALATTNAKIFYICNSTTQPGQTEGFTQFDHIFELEKALGSGVIEYVCLNDAEPGDYELVEHFDRQGLTLMRVNEAEVEKMQLIGITPVIGNFISESQPSHTEWNKLSTIKFDGEKIARRIVDVVKKGVYTR